MSKSILFTRDYKGYTGGHKKVRDYLDHVLSANNWQVSLHLDTSDAVKPPLFSDIPGVTYQSAYNPEHADVVFLAGQDWQTYLPFYQQAQPKVNLIQHVRHADKSLPLFQYLQYPATRICVSKAVADAIKPFANGPVQHIQMGHVIEQTPQQRQYDVYILANKQPELGQALADAAKTLGIRVSLDAAPTAPDTVHSKMAQSHVVLTLPDATEGFYLPGIEAMCLADVAIVPDCIANREYMTSLSNALLCELTFESCYKAIQTALKHSQHRSNVLRKWVGRRIAHRYSLVHERRQFLRVLSQL